VSCGIPTSTDFGALKEVTHILFYKTKARQQTKREPKISLMMMQSRQRALKGQVAPNYLRRLHKKHKEEEEPDVNEDPVDEPVQDPDDTNGDPSTGTEEEPKEQAGLVVDYKIGMMTNAEKAEYIGDLEESLDILSKDVASRHPAVTIESSKIDEAVEDGTLNPRNNPFP